MKVKSGIVMATLLMFATAPVLAGQMSGAVAGAVDTAKVNNKICPVSGEEAGGMGKVVEAEYNGKIYNLCCAMCKKDFMKDPEKYSAIADEEVKGGQPEEDAHDHHDHDH